MSSAPSVPGVEAGASWLGSREHVLAAGALEMLATLNGTFGPEDAQQGRRRLAPGLADRQVKVTGPSDRKVVINELNCGAQLFVADVEDEPIPVARVAQVFDASVQGVPVGYHLADALDGPGRDGLAQRPDGRFDPAIPS